MLVLLVVADVVKDVVVAVAGGAVVFDDVASRYF